MKKTADYSHINHNAGIPGQSSPRPLVIPRMNTTVHHNNVGFIGPQLPPHMNKVRQIFFSEQQLLLLFFLNIKNIVSFTIQGSLHANGNGSLRDYPSSKPSTSSSGHGLASSSSSVSHSISRPTMIPDHDKRQKLSFFIGQGKPIRPTPASASHSQPSSASCSLSSSQSTSDIQSDVRFIPRQLNHVNGTSRVNGDHHSGGNGASFLVPYSQESSEESDQENSSTLDNGKSHINGTHRTGNDFDTASHDTNGETEEHHNENGLNGSTYVTSKSSQNGHHHNGRHKVSGHKSSDQVISAVIMFMLHNNSFHYPVTDWSCFAFRFQTVIPAVCLL